MKKLEKVELILVDIFLKYISQMNRCVKTKNLRLRRKRLRFLAMFCRSSTVTLFMLWLFPTRMINKLRLLSFGLISLEDKENFHAQPHLDYLQLISSNFEKSSDNVVCYIFDNCNTNKSIETTLCLPIVACYNQKFKFVV